MAVNNLNIFHLYHSGVVIKTEDKLMIFDYYKDDPAGQERKISNGVITEKELNEKKEIYVFVSHSHGDHYQPLIFNWEEKTDSEIKYILSNDINIPNKKENYYFMDKYQTLNFNELKVKTYGTTDRGVSFLVKNRKTNIFHSGDLNWWHWKNNSVSKQKQEEKDYKEEINQLEGHKIDIAFVPVDPRLDEYYYLAGEYFAQKIKPEYLIPIHFGGQFDITTKFADKINDLEVASVIIEKRGQEIKI